MRIYIIVVLRRLDYDQKIRQILGKVFEMLLLGCQFNIDTNAANEHKIQIS